MREHLVRRLMMEPRWTADVGEESLLWQPWVLPVLVGVEDRGTHPDGTPYIEVKARVDIATVPDEAAGIDLARLGGDHCPMATFCWWNGTVSAAVAVVVNRDGRSNLVLLHNAVLAMATVAHEVASVALGEGWDLPEPHPAAPAARQEPDELLQVFGEADPLGLQRVRDAQPRWAQARPLLRSLMLGNGWDEGYRSDDVDFYTRPDGRTVGVGLDHRPRYGPGLRLQAIVSPPLPVGALPPEFPNDGNAVLALAAPHTFGNLSVNSPEGAWESVALESFLMWPYLDEAGPDPADLATSAFNALAQFAAVAGHADLDRLLQALRRAEAERDAPA